MSMHVALCRGCTMAKRPYPKKSDDERRLVISLTLSDDRLRWFKEMMSLQSGHEPTVEEIRAYARDIAQSAIDEQIKRKIEFNDAMII